MVSKEKPEARVLQIEDIFRFMNIQITDDTREILSTAFSFLLYLRPGDSLQYSQARFNKISSDLIQVDHNLDPANILDSLEKRKVIKIPL